VRIFVSEPKKYAGGSQLQCAKMAVHGASIAGRRRGGAPKCSIPTERVVQLSQMAGKAGLWPRHNDCRALRTRRRVGGVSAFHSRTGTTLRHLVGEAQEPDMRSYVLFDGEYASDLIDFGLYYARAREEESARSFPDCGGGPGR
jgi:hypothetical protein